MTRVGSQRHKKKKHGTIISVHEVVKGGSNNAACFVGIIQARCQTAKMITSRVPFQGKLFVFLSHLFLNRTLHG